MYKYIDKRITSIFHGEERNLFFISTAFQLISAMEAQEYFKTKNNILVLLFYGNNHKDQEQIQKVLKLFNYSQLIIFDVSNKKKHINVIIELIKELKQHKLKYLFCGFFSTNIRRFITNMNYEKLILIDDGVYTISIHNELYGNDKKKYRKYILPYSEKKRETLIKQLRFYTYNQMRKVHLILHGMKNDMKTMNLGFFTIFNLSQHGDEFIVKNNYTSLKNKYNLSEDTSSENIVYFLGQPLIKSLGITKDSYLKYLQIIFSQYNKKIIYIPHRAEKKSLIDDILKLDIENLMVKEINLSFELYILENKLSIEHLASFLSTALFSMKALYPKIKIDAFKLELTGDIENTTNLIYETLEKAGTNISIKNLTKL